MSVKKKNIVIFGASGHGSVVLDCLEKMGNFDVVGFIDSFQRKGIKIFGYEILGNEFDLPLLVEKYAIQGGIVAIGDNWTRHLMVQRILSVFKNFNFISAIHPTATIGKDVTIGKGVTIMPGAIINPNSIVGDFCIINTNSSLGHNGNLKPYSTLSPGVCVGGNFTLGQFSVMSLGAKVIENVCIGAHTVIGAGSLVLHDIQEQVLAHGSPAVVIRNRAIGESYMGKKKKAYYPKLVHQSKSIILSLFNQNTAATLKPIP